ncbi:MAG: 3-deoxy-7-phosphoheptulonate synthase class II [Acidobacteria bacterium]|nr:3-deoxy-7-phosphoheptulonate synthase class II [Acidobacteriota bacterium]
MTSTIEKEETTAPAGRHWAPDSWRSRPVLQQPPYPDPEAVQRVVRELASLPPLVTSWEIETLKEQLAESARGERFLLQGGDCAEIFAECRSESITNKLKILLQMSLVLVHGLQRRVIRVGRFAGQYAKPRSSDYETVDGVTLAAYRGDLVNDIAFDPAKREPDPQRMLRGYERAALTLNFIRGLIDGGFADLHHPEYWELGFVEHSPMAAEYQRMVETIGRSVRFMETLAGRSVGHLDRVDFFTSHEGLHLPYEQAQTRKVPRREGWYDLSTHFPWIGMRTADPEGAHVEFFRGIQNPIAIKLGPAMTREWLLRLLDVLHPNDEPGRLTLIHRLGADGVESHLPGLIEAVRESGKTVVWVCDPMHGNTRMTASGFKTRHFEDILKEVEESLRIHDQMDSHLGGIHVELTGEAVTECVGGARGLDESGLSEAYQSFVDPRLNYEQALEMALLIARRYSEAAGAGSRAPESQGSAPIESQ